MKCTTDGLAGVFVVMVISKTNKFPFSRPYILLPPLITMQGLGNSARNHDQVYITRWNLFSVSSRDSAFNNIARFDYLQLSLL